MRKPFALRLSLPVAFIFYESIRFFKAQGNTCLTIDEVKGENWVQGEKFFG